MRFFTAKSLSKAILNDEESISGSIEGEAGSSYRCLKRVIHSHSSLMRDPLYFFPEFTTEGDIINEAFNYDAFETKSDDTGIEAYKRKCSELQVVSFGKVLRNLGEAILDLKYYSLTENELSALCSALSQNIFVKELILQDNWMTLKAVKNLNDMLTQNSTIKVLNLQQCNLGPEGSSILKDALEYNSMLEELDLSHNFIGVKGIKNISKGLTYNRTIKKVNLGHNDLDEKSVPFLKAFLEENSTVIDLNLEWNFLNSAEALKLLGKGLLANKGVQNLSLAWNGLEAAKNLNLISKYIRKTEYLKMLDLSFNSLNKSSLKRLAKSMVKCESLELLKIGNNKYTPGDALDFVKVLTLESCIVKCIDFGDLYFEKDLIPIVKQLRQTGKDVKFGGYLSHYQIFGPDVKKVLFDRCRYLAMKPKKKKKRKDFGHIVLTLPTDVKLTADMFERFVKKKTKTIDRDLFKALEAQFITKGKKINVALLMDEYMKLYPDTKLPEEKPQKKKKGKGKHKRSDKVKKSTSAEKPVEKTETEIMISDMLMQYLNSRLNTFERRKTTTLLLERSKKSDYTREKLISDENMNVISETEQRRDLGM